MIKVLVIDDHEMFAESLVRLLREDPEIEVLGAVDTAQAGVELAIEKEPDIVLMDYGLPDINGAMATRQIRDKNPHIKVIMLTGSEHAGAYVAAIEAGSAAWLRKTKAGKELRATIHRVYQGQIVEADELTDLPTVDQLVVFYQPIMDLRNSRLVGLEALVRGVHPERGLVAPEEFIERAESTGFIHEMGRYVGEQACRQMVAWKQEFVGIEKLWVSVNVSVSGFYRPGLVPDIEQFLLSSGVAPEDLVIEMTENVLIEDAPGALEKLDALKHLGVKLALDDFGTGYSSLSYLRQFPFDHVKLDKSFTEEVPWSPKTMRLVEAIHLVVAALDMSGIAEGVENPAQAAALLKMGWEYGQGFLYGKPQSAEAVAELFPTLAGASRRGVGQKRARKNPRGNRGGLTRR